MLDNNFEKFSIIALKSLLCEILKDGKVEEFEKRKFQKLLKSVNLSKETLREIQHEAKKMAKDSPQYGPLDERKYLTNLKFQFSIELNAHDNLSLLRKIATILESDQVIINEFLPSLFLEIQLKDSNENQYSVAEELAQQSLETSSDHSSDHDQLENRFLDTLLLLKESISNESRKYFNKIISLRQTGQHNQAIEELLDYSTPLSYEIRYALLTRIYFEIHDLIRAKEYLDKAEKSGASKLVMFQENFFLEYESNQLDANFEKWKLFFENSDVDLVSVSDENCFESLIAALKSRNRNVLAVELIEFYLEKDTTKLQLRDEFLRKLLDQLLSHTFFDIYFKYYGKTIIAVQLAASLLILSICIYNVGYVIPAFIEILHQMVAGIPNVAIFKDSLKKLLPFTFLVVALVPVCYVNGIMFWAGIQNKTKSYTQIHDHFIKICDFGRIYHLCFEDIDKSLFLYQDDNDYTYVSLVRHLPFVPNFTYIYAYDYLRKIYCLLPLYGVADGFLFNKQYLPKKSGLVFPMNMLGVRLAQASTVIAKLSRTYLIILPIIILMGIFFYANISFVTEASFNSYLLSFVLFLGSFGFLIYLPWLTVKLMGTNYLNLIFTVNIIKPGLIFLMGLYLINHYAYVGISAVIPISVCLYSFYILFIKTKYSNEKKQIVAQVSAIQVDQADPTKPITLSHGLQSVYLGKEPGASKNTLYLYYNKDHMAISRKIFGLNLYYDVITITSKFSILVMGTETGSRLRISTHNYEVDQKIEDIQEVLNRARLPFVIEEFDERGGSKIPLHQLVMCCLILFIWQFTSGLASSEYEPVVLNVNKQDVARVEHYLQKSQNISAEKDIEFTHSFEDLKYLREIDVKSHWITFFQARVMKWGQYEKALQSGLQIAKNSPNTTSIAYLGILDTQKIDSFVSNLPPFIRVDGFRDDVFNFFDWHLFTRWKTINSEKHARDIIDYCPIFGARALERNGKLHCAYRFSFQDAVDWIAAKESIPVQFDEKIISELLRIRGDIIRFASTEIKANADLILAAVRQNGLTLEFASENLKNNSRIVSAALSQNLLAYKFMGTQMWNDKQIMRDLVNKDGSLITNSLVSDEIRGTPGIVLNAIKQNPGLIAKMYQNSSINEVMTVDMLDNPLVAIELVRNEGRFLKRLNSQMRANSEIVQAALKNNGMSLEWASKDLRDDRSTVLFALDNNAAAHHYMGETLWRDRDIVKRVLNDDGMQLQKLADDFRKDRELVRIAINQNSRASEFMDSKFWSDPEIVKKLVNMNGLYIKQVGSKLKSDPKILIDAVKQNGMALQFVPDDLKNNFEIIKAALNSDGRALRFANYANRSNPEFIDLAASNQLEALKYAIEEDEWFLKNKKSTYLAYIFENGIGRPQNLERARELYSNAAESGEVNAMIKLAYLHLESKGPMRDYDKAYKWFSNASEMGSLEGITMLGFMKQKSMSVNKDVNGARQKYLEVLALSKQMSSISDDSYKYVGAYPKAAFFLGRLYLSGEMEAGIDLDAGRRWLLIAAEQGHLEAQKLLIDSYFKASDVSRLFNRSYFWALNAADHKDLEVRFILGLHLQLGLGTSENRKAAEDIYRELKVAGIKGLDCLICSNDSEIYEPPDGVDIAQYIVHAAEKGSAAFQCLIGSDFNIKSLHHSEPDEVKIEWLRKSAKQGNYEAQIRLARQLRTQKKFEESIEWNEKAIAQNYARAYTVKAESYLSGSGYLKNYETSFKLFEKAAVQNERVAQRQLAMLYQRGNGVSKNLKVAFEWYQKASVNGDHVAMVNMGTMYEFGTGIPQNQDLAIIWYKRAAAMGNLQAKENLKILFDQGVNIHATKYSEASQIN